MHSSNDNCTTIADANGISVATLEIWNPSLMSDCSGLSSNTYICVGVTSNDTTSSATTLLSTTASPVSSTTSPTTATASTTSAAATPSPIQVCGSHCLPESLQRTD